MSDEITPPTRKQAREARLALELRANLTRRKALSRARSAAPGDKPADEVPAGENNMGRDGKTPSE
ncbi:MAG: hypothetical protein ABL894_13830 [Hyphomicrobium sp.]